MLVARKMGKDTLLDCRQLWSSAPDGWCWCVAWEVDSWEGWTDRSASQNQALRERLWARDEFSLLERRAYRMDTRCRTVKL